MQRYFDKLNIISAVTPVAGQIWTAFKTTRTWSWGGLEEKTCIQPALTALISKETITWKAALKIMRAAPQRGWIGYVNLRPSGVWCGHDGFISLDNPILEAKHGAHIMMELFAGSIVVNPIHDVKQWLDFNDKFATERV